MKSVLITGATGNAGMEVIASLRSLNAPLEIIAGVRNVIADAAKLAEYSVQLRSFDFTDSSTYDAALSDSDYLFLMRPPPVSNVAKYFKPLIAAAKRVSIQHIVFLSVQGVEKSSIIPHNKIERWIAASGIPYTFLRPAYFMQNFTTTLHRDLIEKGRVFLPAGEAKFTLVDLRDFGLVAATVFGNTEDHAGRSYELTSDEALSFRDMAKRLSIGLGKAVRYESPNLLRFYLAKRAEGVAPAMVLVMMMLHYLPRFQKPPAVTDCVRDITGSAAKSFDTFIKDHIEELQ